MALHIGILAHSGEGAALCYRTAIHEGIRRMGPHNHPEIRLTGVAMHEALAAWDRLDLAALHAIFAADAAKLAAAGADFFVLPDNSAHRALEASGEPFAIPCLHIAEIVAEQAKTESYRQVGILGTRWTMEGPVYPRHSSDARSPGRSPERPTGPSFTTSSWTSCASASSATSASEAVTQSLWFAPRFRC